MTSNLGMQEMTSQASKIGFAEKSDAATDKVRLEAEYEHIKNGVLDQLKKDLRPEFLNRIDKVIVYRPLGFEQLKKITALQIGYLQDRLIKQEITLRTTPPVIKFIAEQSFDPAQGARFIRRNIQNLLEDPLAEAIIGAGLTKGSTVSVEVKRGKLDFQTSTKKERVPAI